jgi:hypothetical protein
VKWPDSTPPRISRLRRQNPWPVRPSKRLQGLCSPYPVTSDRLLVFTETERLAILETIDRKTEGRQLANLGDRPTVSKAVKLAGFSSRSDAACMLLVTDKCPPEARVMPSAWPPHPVPSRPR